MSHTIQDWMRFFEKYVDVDHRRCLGPRDVPATSESSRVSFVSWNQYVATLGSGALIEAALADRKKIQKLQTRLVLLEHGKGNRTKFMCLFKVPEKCQENFAEKDKASAHMSKNQYLRTPTYDSRGPWDITILPTVPMGPPEVAWATIERRRDPTAGEYHDQQNYPVTSFSEFDTLQQRRGMQSAIWYLFDNASIFATIIPEDRHSIFVYVIKALLDLRSKVTQSQDGGISKLLLGTSPDEVARLDIYQSLSDSSLADEDKMYLNESQKEAIRFSRNAPAGLVLCHGGPGTGKTHFIIHAVRPFLLDTAKQHRVLVTAASNTSVDSVAKALDEQLRQIATNRGSNQPYVIRLHSIKTEKSVAFREAKLARQASLAAKKNKPPASQSNPRPLVPGQAATILAHCQALMERKYEGVSDERVSVIELSVGERMLEIAGIRGESPLNTESRFTEFADLYMQFINGDEFSFEKSQALDDEMEELLAYTINHASVVCATIGGAADGFFCKHYADAELIVVDEAARVPEYQMWPLLACYPKAVGKILVGDPNQLGPMIKGDGTRDDPEGITNPFQRQLEMSLQQRLQSAGFQSAFFNVQYRAVEKIAQIYSNVCYGGLLQHGRTSELEDDQLAKAIIEHNRQIYGIPEPVVFYTITDAKQERNRYRSRFCREYIILVLKILQNLFDAGFGTPRQPCSIAILTPYTEEKKLLKISKARMAETYPVAKDVILQTVDSVQGMEYDVVIVDPTVVDSPGFLDENRLNVMFSRARYGLYVVGDYGSWISMRKDDSKPLRNFAAEFNAGYRIKWDRERKDQPLSSPFFDDDMI